MSTLRRHLPVSFDVVEKEYKVDLPANHAAILYGAMTADWKQQVTATLQKDVGTTVQKDTFEGKGDGLLTLQDQTYTSTIVSVDEDRKLVLTFKAQKPGGSFEDSEVKWKELEISTYATFYVFYTEDGGDQDNHDTDFCVSILPTTK